VQGNGQNDDQTDNDALDVWANILERETMQGDPAWHGADAAEVRGEPIFSPALKVSSSIPVGTHSGHDHGKRGPRGIRTGWGAGWRAWRRNDAPVRRNAGFRNTT
jgi:hypothetical protein